MSTMEVAGNIEHVRRGFWQFGDIVRVDPTKNPMVPQPDDRRWMVLVAANTSAARQWELLFLGPSASLSAGSLVVPFSSMYGFELVEEGS
jgi:hypothetical protein